MDTLILTSLLVSMGISTFTSKEVVFLCRVSKIGNNINSYIHQRYIPNRAVLATRHPL